MKNLDPFLYLETGRGDFSVQNHGHLALEKESVELNMQHQRPEFPVTPMQSFDASLTSIQLPLK
jgi:hypothetical protein